MPDRAEVSLGVVVKIMDQTAYEQALAAGRYAGSADDMRDGFIHLSAPEQLAGTLEKHYAGRSDLVAIAFLAEDLAPGLKWEVSRGGALFPHYYGTLPMDRARRAVSITRAPDGRFVIPDLENA